MIEVKEIKLRPISSVWLTMTENCNLRCVYCFERNCSYKGEVLPLETAKKAVDLLLENAKEGNTIRPEICFFGGEPTLVPELCTQVLEYTIEKAKKYYVKNKNGEDIQMKPRFLIITNATIFNDKLRAFYERWFELTNEAPHIQVSLEGIPDLQDTNRPSANSNIKSHELVEATIAKYLEMFKEHGWDTDSINVHTVLSRNSLPQMTKTYEYVTRSLGLKHIGFGWCQEDPWEDSDLDVFDREMRKLTESIINFTTNKNRFPFKTFTDGHSSGCGTGKSLISVTPNGDIYPCHRFYFYTKENPNVSLKIGNLYNTPAIDEELRRPYVEADHSKIVCGESCQVCPACNYEMTGDMMKVWDGYFDAKLQRVINYHREIFEAKMDAKNLNIVLKRHEDRIRKLEAVAKKIENLELDIDKDTDNPSEDDLR